MSAQTLPTITNQASGSERRYDLDWLRVIAFGLLILYHIGMFYVTWDWHVKSPHAGPWLEPVMALLNPWRLPLLFLISGIALRFAIDKSRLSQFVPRRFMRLFAPIAFGMLVVCAPQAYFELYSNGETGSDFWAFYGQYLDFDMEFSILTPTWNHLWYLVYILAYTLVVVALLPLLRRLDGAAEALFEWLGRGAFGWRLLLVPTLPFIGYASLLAPHFPSTHAFYNDWANHAELCSIVLIGWFAAKSPAFWRAVQRRFGAAVALALALLVVLAAARLNWGAVRAEPGLATLVMVVRTVFMWATIVALLGLAQRTLNRNGKMLRFLTGAVFPYYILHQTLIVAVGFWVGGLLLPVWLEAAIITTATVVGCVVLTEAIKRIPPLRPLFGLPVRAEPSRPARQVAVTG
ncbi:MAG TPA: acyltransferase family protein [Devosia sp.]|jgi:peptidoglycan/LPS O-acetylase OafA/YrhL|uniref:acyltransferase family protein n=1 Tax=Devosia sp. TaxID=1871048 RepID=UPI002DDD7F3C|nr:acyltransferase family protein [Devosia sp.]HEV2514274.1 acyltransferase family protein [Devosia sp.]